jgi:hypothetical protein
MPRWKDLPDELDPQVGEFTVRLRQIVDRAGLNVTALADRTGYGRASWERYLNGRLLAPKGAVVALAEVTGTNPAHLITLWELAERAWSRSELRQDRTAEAVRLSRARTVTSPEPGTAGPAGVFPAAPRTTEPADARPTAPPGPHARRPAVFLAAAVGVVLVAAGAFLLTDGGTPSPDRTVAASPPPSVDPTPTPPAGVGCVGAGCTGKDAEKTGCGGALATTARSVTVGGTLVEVRYSETCGAAWGRITRAAQGDEVRLTVGSARQAGDITTAGDTIAYTPMLATDDPATAQVCAALASGEQGCTG